MNTAKVIRVWLVSSDTGSASWPVSMPTRQQRRTAATKARRTHRRKDGPWIPFVWSLMGPERSDAGRSLGFARAFARLSRRALDRHFVRVGCPPSYAGQPDRWPSPRHRSRRRRAQRDARIWFLSEGA